MSGGDGRGHERDEKVCKRLTDDVGFGRGQGEVTLVETGSVHGVFLLEVLLYGRGHGCVFSSIVIKCVGCFVLRCEYMMRQE